MQAMICQDVAWHWVKKLEAQAYVDGLRHWIRKGKPHLVCELELRWSARVTEGLRQIGFKRIPKELPDLDDYLEGKYTKESNGEEKTDANA